MRLFLSAAVLALATAAAAQTNYPDLHLAAGKPYRHAPSGLEVPAMLDGLPRTRGTAFVAEQLDEAVEFKSADGGEDISVYIFRHVTGSVPVWFDRSVWAIEHRDVYRGAAAVRPPAAFTPPDQANASGLIVTYSLPKGRYRSTALAHMPLGPDWYVVVRYTSATLDGDALDARLRAVILALDWPRKIAAQPDALPIAPCTTKLALNGPSAVVKDDTTIASALFGGAMAGAMNSRSKRDLSRNLDPPTTWCRDSTAFKGLERHGLYRPAGSTDAYLIAYEDAGRGVMVERDAMAALLDQSAEPPATWSVNLIEIAQITTFASRDRLPPPDQAIEIVEHAPYASKITTWGKARSIQMNPAAIR